MFYLGEPFAKNKCELINVMLFIQAHPTSDQLINDCHGTKRKPLASEEISVQEFKK